MQPHLLSPYRLPTTYPLQMQADETAAWLNGWAALWHPAALAAADRLPQCSSTYDHDTPGQGNVYCRPDGPALYQPDDWPARVQAANAVSFAGTAGRDETFANLLAALRDRDPNAALTDAPPELVQQFTGVGFGYLLLESLYDAMEHDHLLDTQSFWGSVSAAVDAAKAGNGDDVRTHLKAAAETLLYAREQLTPGNISWLDWAIPDPANADAPWPASLHRGVPLTLLASAEYLEKLAADHPERFAELRAKFPDGLPAGVDLCVGAYRDREDALLPVESQLWNLRAARRVTKALFGADAEVYGRRKSAYHPQLPSWLQHFGYKHAVLVSFDGAVLPQLRASVVNWPAPDGRAVDAFTRDPLPAHDVNTFFNLAYHLHQATSTDSSPTLAIGHRGKPAAAPYHDLLALADLAPVFGEWVGLGRYFADAMTGEYVGAQQADEFFADYLDDRVTNEKRPDPVSGFARHHRLRRRLDSAFTLAALHHSLTPFTDADRDAVRALEALEDEAETRGPNTPPGEDAAGPADPPPLAVRVGNEEARWAAALAARLQARAADGTPGLLVFNPSGFVRRVALELDGFAGPIPVDGPVKAAQFDGGTAKLVVEVPGLGFAWVPRTAPAGTAAPKSRMKLADGTTVRNEFFEADVDPETGGLRAFRDHRTRQNRLGQQLVFNPGSKMRASSVSVTASGSALGEITTTGEIVDDHDNVKAAFRQRFRAWLGRPALEVRIELDVKHAPTGYPWHAYFGARFGWRDDRAVLFRGVNGSNAMTTYTRPVTPDYLEVRIGAERSFLFTGGLPFVQRHGGRMADVVLVPEGERETTFDLLLALDREQPMQTALGWTAPAPVVLTDKGPPPVGPSGWLSHVDLPSLALLSLRPAEPGDGMTRAVVGQFLECAGFGGAAEWRFARDPNRALLVDGNGTPGQELTLTGDAVGLEFSAGELVRAKAEWA